MSRAMDADWSDIRDTFGLDPRDTGGSSHRSAACSDICGAYVPLTFNVGGSSKRGRRPKNDDAFRIGRRSCFFALSDGIGGAPDGDVISRVACGRSLESYEEEGDLEKAFRAGNDTATRVSELIDSPYSGATLLIASFCERWMDLAWVGDSAAFRLRGGRLERLTGIGRIAATNVLDAAVGYEYGIRPSIAAWDVAPGDRFLLCTDGVWEPFEETLGIDRLAQLLSEGANAPRIAERIAQTAAENGTDNATAIVVIALSEDPDGMRDDIASTREIEPIPQAVRSAPQAAGQVPRAAEPGQRAIGQAPRAAEPTPRLPQMKGRRCGDALRQR